MRQLLTAPMVARGLSRSVGWFLRNRADLESDHGFPAPVDGCGMRWDPAAIEDWLDARRKRAVPPELAAEATLIQRARAMAEGLPA